jgi:hypothetical protein
MNKLVHRMVASRWPFRFRTIFNLPISSFLIRAHPSNHLVNYPL